MLPNDPDTVASDLQALVDHVHLQLRSIEEVDLDEFFSGAATEEEKEETEYRADIARAEAADRIRWALRTLSARLQLYCEAFSLPETRRAAQNWHERWPTPKLGETKHWSTSDGDGQGSPALDEIQPLVDGLIALLRPRPTEPPQTAADRFARQRLEHCLRSIAKIIHEHKATPTSEADVQKVLHSHLEGVFDDYTRTLTIAKPLASFKPDGGLTSLRAAIECKFVDNEDELATAMHGITEDLSGYAGSRDWTTFYTLIYMTGPYTTERHVSRALGLSGNAGTWTVIVVTGAGGRVKKARPTRGGEVRTRSEAGVVAQDQLATDDAASSRG